MKFKFSHSIWGTLALLVIEGVFITFFSSASTIIVLLIAVVGAAGSLYVATEVVEEIRKIREMFLFLCANVSQFILFFAFQYYFLLQVSPESFPTLGSDTVSLLLQSTMVFVFNPLEVPSDIPGRILLLINTFASLGLVLFVIQNMWQLRNNAHK